MTGNGGAPNPLERDVPLGNGVAQQTAQAMCPYCWEWALLRLDPGSGPSQRYVEDCPVCCRPWDVTITYGGDGSVMVDLRAEDES